MPLTSHTVPPAHSHACPQALEQRVPSQVELHSHLPLRHSSPLRQLPHSWPQTLPHSKCLEEQVSWHAGSSSSARGSLALLLDSLDSLLARGSSVWLEVGISVERRSVTRGES